MLEIEDALTKSQNKVQNYRSKWFQFFKILPPSFYWQCFQTPATQLSSVISTSSSRGFQQRDTLIYVSCSNFSTTMTLVIWKLLSIWKSAFWMSFQTILETSDKKDPNQQSWHHPDKQRIVKLSDLHKHRDPVRPSRPCWALAQCHRLPPLHRLGGIDNDNNNSNIIKW